MIPGADDDQRRLLPRFRHGGNGRGPDVDLEAPVSAEAQLRELRSDPRAALRGVPIIAKGGLPGTIRYTAPESCLDRLARLAQALDEPVTDPAERNPR